MPHLSVDVSDQVATISLNNPPQNRLAEQMIGELENALTAVGQSDARAVLLRAEGPDFSFGGDILPWQGRSNAALRSLFERYMNAFNRFERLPLPVIVAVQGLCFGGGLELALRADIVFAGESARFGHPEQTLGVATMLGGVYRVAERAGRFLAAEWAFTSEQVQAVTMERFGLVNRVVPDGKLLEEANAFAAKMAKGPTRAHVAHKALLRAWTGGGVHAADQAMFDIAMPLFETEDAIAGLTSAIRAAAAGKTRPVIGFKGR
ncbi:Short-chain-enoyl-CoA hydratase [Paraburkholderia graminis C4D1M]|uniref:Enoyl-CoA hydratase/isomerase n=1 Tax=Paraburkholderia graminis (strain ATCC 700544 / DSM 17151 / LMG 18924 / NCIMB 13744 / C4D1M) TaxID=396598 RepID=B1G492_PARG4|nr:enoyl-CoA hydratase/isomerase family protein [Paraburkholderia graminis]EDT09081.1 Enoyl-CoA hydratase/isomerase [Paraburkholderia graminis C4D1M]CAB3734539.1 Short-chain-enoyl-CoA hydratase [Paraburkholderia graminis C4D1M]